MDIKDAINLLEQKKASCLLIKDEEIIFESQEDRLKPLLELHSDSALKIKAQGAVLIDRVIGKAAYALAAGLGVKEIYTPLSSDLALALADNLEDKEADFVLPAIYAEKIVPYILNEKQNGYCPMEKKVENCTSVSATVKTILG